MGLMWKKWLSLHCYDDSGSKRERLELERGKKGREERRIERKWHPVKAKSSTSDKVEPRTVSEMKRDFLNIISFHLPTFFFSCLRCHLHGVWVPTSSRSSPFYFAFDLLSAISSLSESKTLKKKKVLLFITQSAGVHQMTMEKLTFYITHQEQVNEKNKKNKEPHAKNSSSSQHNHHISEKCAAAYFPCHFVLKIRFFMIHFATENKFVCL